MASAVDEDGEEGAPSPREGLLFEISGGGPPIDVVTGAAGIIVTESVGG